MIFHRGRYVDALIRKQWNGRIKVITGIRRCGKSTVLFDLFRTALVTGGVDPDHIVAVALDDDRWRDLRDPYALADHLRSRIGNSGEKYYVFLDEIQYAISREELRDPDRPVRLYDVLNGLLHSGNADVYVTGSNSKLLSRDISTEFRGRGDVVHVHPLSFREFLDFSGMDVRDAYDEYATFGGMPYLLSLKDDDEKFQYLDSLFEEIYFKDIESRYGIRLPGVLRELTSCLCSAVGSLTSAARIARTVSSTRGRRTDPETISAYLGYLTDSFLFSRADRYDVKGRRYFDYPSKYYCADVGLRNVRLGLRQQEPTHIMENIIYNELLIRGFAVDVGNLEVLEPGPEGKRSQKILEVDFIARRGSRKYYIQSALSMDDEDKERTELRPLLAIDDSFRKVVVSRTYGRSWTDDKGILRLGLLDFLTDEGSLDR